MIIIRPSVCILSPEFKAWRDILQRIELAGRTCYQSEEHASADSYIGFIQRLIARGHESVLEHASMTARFICDRGVSHELVRHRLASYSQESTRYCCYKDQITVILPCFWPEDSHRYQLWENFCEQAETAYLGLLAFGASPQEARSVLPNSLKTEIVITANLREWRHIFRLRLSKAAHPQMREVMWLLLNQVKGAAAPVFDDIKVEF